MVSLAGCFVNDKPLKTDLAPTVRLPDRSAILFYIDGVGDDVFEKHLQAGTLPNIKRYIIDRGLRYRRTVTCMPSITYAATATFLTGMSPGYHGIVGNRWFDPYSMRYQAYGYIKTYRTAQNDFDAPTIFEILHDQFTFSIQVATRRGVTREIDNWATSGISWYFGRFADVDKLTAMRFDLIAQMANQTGHWPRFIFAYLPACDKVAHNFGIDSREYDRAIRNADEQIGRICRSLQRAGVFDRTLLVLTTDHGQAPMRDKDGVIDAARYLASHFGMRVTDHRLDNDDFIKRFEFYNRYDVVAVPDAPRLLGLHLREAGKQWYDRPTDVRPMALQTGSGQITAEQLAEQLATMPYSRFVAIRAGSGKVQMVSRRGKALVHVNGPASSQPATTQLAGSQDVLYTYRILEGHDPLDLGLPELSGEAVQGHPAEVTLSGTQWLTRTIDSSNPGVVSQIATYFYSDRAGDIVVFAEPGYGFAIDLSGHGSTTPSEMRVPLVFAGPGVDPGVTDEAARIQSIMPTIVTSLGFGERLDVEIPLDGPVLQLGRQMQPLRSSR